MGISANLMRLGWLVFLGCLLAGCKAISVADSADDTKQWQGTWKLVASTYDGEPQMADMEWIVDGDHYNIRLNGHLHEDLNWFKLDASRKQIDVFHHETPPGTYGGKLKGIYERLTRKTQFGAEVVAKSPDKSTSYVCSAQLRHSWISCRPGS